MPPKKNSPALKRPRVPPEVGGIQINFCKNPRCSNFGIPASATKPSQSSPSSGQSGHYRIVASLPGTPLMRCTSCGETFPVKSNLAIAEELARLSAFLVPTTYCCPVEQCSNHAVSIDTPKHYRLFGTTAAGSARYQCKACSRLFSVAKKAGLRQRQPAKNRMIFSLLMNKSPMRRICEVAQINAVTLYQRIDFFSRQCLAFAAHRERHLLDGSLHIPRLYLAVDRQDYVINWTNQADRRNVTLHAAGSADDNTGYVFGMHLDFDSGVDGQSVETDAVAIGDYAKPYAFRRYARVWLQEDYSDALRQYWKTRKRKQRQAKKSTSSLVASIQTTYDTAANRGDVEQAETMDFDTQLPLRGMQTHSEYTLYGHFFYLERMLRGVEKIRFFMDQESAIRAACLGAFRERVAARTVDAFYVRIDKSLTVNERRYAIAQSRAEFDATKVRYPGLSESEVEVKVIQERLAQMATIGKWSDRWVLHPFPSMSEPDKAACYLTDFQDYDPDHLARLYARASLHAIDRFFMQVRRRLSILERPIQTASAQRRTWYGYSPYNPEVVEKLLTIFRVFYNYVAVGDDKKTPAMRLGLAKASIDIEDILYFITPVH